MNLDLINNMVNIIIDGKPLTVAAGTMIIEAADQAGINIPRFCYHKKLSIAANCRMCLVEVEKARKPMPACATPIRDGMKIFTTSKAAIESQRAVMEFLLINHPLDCPVCDQGGECELQDVSMEYGSDVSVFTQGKRAVENFDLGPLVSTEMTRCIHCTRCVRFGVEIAGVSELGAVGRGEHMEITTYVKHSLRSELSGNIIDLCPVGALTSKPFRFKARSWEMQQYASVSPHDIVGTNIFFNIHQGKVLRVLPCENEAINEVWITDRDRFSYEALNVDYRAKSPMIKQNGVWKTVQWQYVLEYTLSSLQKIVSSYGVEQIGALISPTASCEEMYLLQQLFRGFGCNNIDHRLLEVDCSDQAYLPRMPLLGISIEQIESLNALLLIGSNIRKEQPLLSHRLNQAYVENQALIYALNPQAFDFVFKLAGEIITDSQGILYAVACIAKAAIIAVDVTDTQGDDLTAIEKLLSPIVAKPDDIKYFNALKQNNNTAIWLGALALMHPQASLLRTLVRFIAQASNSSWATLPAGGNAAGAWITGAVPHRTAGGSVLENAGDCAKTMLEKQLKSYFLVALEPELDCNASDIAIDAMKNAQLVISCTSFVTPLVLKHANIILPMAAFSESSGTYVNTQADWQTVAAAINPPGEAKPLWKILRALGSLLQLKGFNYQSLAAVTQQLKTTIKQLPPQAKQPLFIASNYKNIFDKYECNQVNNLILLKYKSIYAIDMLVRQAECLQKTSDGLILEVITLHPNLAMSLNIHSGDQIKIKQANNYIILEAVINANIASNCVSVPAGILKTSTLGACYTPIKIEKL